MTAISYGSIPQMKVSKRSFTSLSSWKESRRTKMPINWSSPTIHTTGKALIALRRLERAFVVMFSLDLRTRDLRCTRQNCSEILILHMSYFNYAHYALAIRFYGLESIHSRYTIKDINFYVNYKMLRRYRALQCSIYLVPKLQPFLHSYGNLVPVYLPSQYLHSNGNFSCLPSKVVSLGVPY